MHGEIDSKVGMFLRGLLNLLTVLVIGAVGVGAIFALLYMVVFIVSSAWHAGR